VRLAALKTVDHEAVELLAEDRMVVELRQVVVPRDLEAADDTSIGVSAKERRISCWKTAQPVSKTGRRSKLPP